MCRVAHMYSVCGEEARVIARTRLLTVDEERSSETVDIFLKYIANKTC